MIGNQYILLIGLLFPLLANAQWSHPRSGELKYHCEACVDVPDIMFFRTSIHMSENVAADIVLRDSIGRELKNWDKVRLNSDADSVVAAEVFRFIARRNGYVEMLLYKPMDWSPQQYETFTYVIPTIKREKEEKRKR